MVHFDADAVMQLVRLPGKQQRPGLLAPTELGRGQRDMVFRSGIGGTRDIAMRDDDPGIMT